MDDNYDEKSSGIVCVVSRRAGAVAGKSVVVSKKFVGCGVKVLTEAKNWLKRPSLRILVPEKSSTTSHASRASAIESRDEQETGRKKAAKALIAALESDLAAAQRDLTKARSNAEKTHSELASQLVELKAEKESLISDLEKAKSGANEASFREGEVKMRVTALEADLTTAQRQLAEPLKKEKIEVVSTGEKGEPAIEQTVAQSVERLNVKAKKQPSHKAVKVEMPAPAAVTDEEAQAAVFANAADKIIFMRAFSDIASQDATVRVDAAKTMAGVRHELSVKVLAAQMACESSAQVRQECIKALAALDMTEALPAVEHALMDEAGSVRLAAVWGLYHLAGAESIPALIRMFADEDEEVRRRAATCIGWLGKEELAVKLLPLLDDNSVSVRRAAAEAMGRLRSRQVVSPLIERLKDPVESVRRVVLAAIETITAKKMSRSFPKNQEEFEHLIVRWQEWWKEELLG
jgi:HEAT repeat protein